MSSDSSEEIDALYNRLRSQVEHENNLYNQRVVWLITMQAFLYATVGFLLQAKVADRDGRYLIEIDAFTALVCFLGMYVALISHQILSDARNVLRHLRSFWNKHTSRLPPDRLDFYPHVSGGEGQENKRFFLRSGNLPLLFAVSWMVGAGILLGHWALKLASCAPSMLTLFKI